MNELLSVIVPVYAVEAYLNDCIASIATQTCKNLEIILVDDGSPDGCGAICDAWAAKDQRIRVIHQENGGLSAARNAGLDAARGAFLTFVDSDDLLEPEMLEAMLRAVKRENADICACAVRNFGANGEDIWGCPSDFVGNSAETLAMLYADTAYPVAAWGKLYRREIWENLRFPVGKCCEDAFTTYKTLHRASKIVQLLTPFYRYRVRAGSIMTAPFSASRMDEEEAWRENAEFVAAHYPALQSAAFDFYLEKVGALLRSIPTGSGEFLPQRRYLRSILRKNTFYILFCGKLSAKKRIKLLLSLIFS